tara:strand:+ start:275 stop:787 length:513 start_codon:yes stop_codon:yes gene_type:complete
MALWGTKDTVYSTGNVNANVTTGVVTKQSGSIAWTAGNGVKVGQVLILADDGAGVGQGVIKSIDSATQVTITTRFLPATNFTDVTYEIRETPKSTLFDSNYAAADIYGVDNNEVGVAVTTKYSVTHGGWVGITSYTDQHGNLRVKTETLVAMSSISGDATDDPKFKDSNP